MKINRGKISVGVFELTMKLHSLEKVSEKEKFTIWINNTWSKSSSENVFDTATMKI